jgi:hypothetical protein
MGQKKRIWLKYVTFTQKMILRGHQRIKNQITADEMAIFKSGSSIKKLVGILGSKIIAGLKILT